MHASDREYLSRFALEPGLANEWDDLMGADFAYPEDDVEVFEDDIFVGEEDLSDGDDVSFPQ